MGQKAKLGRYPMHWHLVGDAPGQYVKNSSFVHSYNRFVSIHGTHQVTLSGNVGYDTIGHGYYLEDGIEHGNVIANNLGADVKSSDAGPTPSDRRASVFWISNPDNTIRGNVAAGGEHVGFWLGFPEHPVGLSTDPSIWPRRTPLRLFDANVSHSNYAYGLFVDGGENPDRTFGSTWYEPRQDPSNPNSPVVPPVFSNFTTYKNRYEAIWLRSFSKPVLRGVKVADSWVGAYFASRSEGAGSVEDSLFVGESGNRGNPSVWETRALDGGELVHFWSPGDSVRGLEYYDGPMTTKNTVFANFASNSQRKAGGITNLTAHPFAVSSMNTLSTASFANANKVWLDPLTANNDGDAFSVIRDLDGSVTGVANQSIVPKNPLLYTGSCTSKPNWNAYICPHSYVSLKIQSSGVDLRGTTIRRADGATYTLTGVPSDRSTQHMVLIEDRQYSVTLPVAIPKKLTFLRWENPGKAARIWLRYPYSNFSVEFENHPVAKASSLSDLSTGGSKYFYDAATQRLHLRVVSTNGAPQSYHVIHN
jgi:cell migration-inducing and hyaluronan-binding protein